MMGRVVVLAELEQTGVREEEWGVVPAPAPVPTKRLAMMDFAQLVAEEDIVAPLHL